jgi:hypothetical protein
MSKKKFKRHATQNVPAGEYFRDIFVSNGCQYYIAARFGVFAGLDPVAANLMHHAVEQLLKGVLCKTKSLNELWNFYHQLPMIWPVFKEQVKVQPKDTTLDLYDGIINDRRYTIPQER